MQRLPLPLFDREYEWDGADLQVPQPAREVVRAGVDDPEAVFLAWLAYPESGKNEQRERFASAVSAAHVKWARHQGAAPAHCSLYAEGAFKNQQLLGTLRRGTDRIGSRRLTAGSMALSLLEGASKSVRAAAADVDENRAPEAPDQTDNYRTRAWTESWPVLHLALCLPLRLQPESRVLSHLDLVIVRGWARHALPTAELWRRALPLVIPGRHRHEDSVLIRP